MNRCKKIPDHNIGFDIETFEGSVKKKIKHLQFVGYPARAHALLELVDIKFPENFEGDEIDIGKYWIYEYHFITRLKRVKKVFHISNYNYGDTKANIIRTETYYRSLDIPQKIKIR